MSKTKVKKKHSTGILVLWCVVMFILGAFAMCGVFYALSEHTDVDWRSYIENTLIPNAIAIVAAIATALLTLKPIITSIANTVTAVIGSFKQAMADVNATVTSSAKSEAEVYESRREFNEIRAEIAEIKECARLLPEAVAVLNETRSELEANTAISRLGFGSMSELTKNGAARIITDGKAKASERTVKADEGNEEAAC